LRTGMGARSGPRAGLIGRCIGKYVPAGQKLPRSGRNFWRPLAG
jgi:hypothetical protein